MPSRLNGISDAELLAAMRRQDAEAWAEFDVRFRPVLEAYARKTNIPRWEWSFCIDDLLADEGLRLSGRDDPPRQLRAYLISAVKNKYLGIKRWRARHDKKHLAASDERSGEWTVPTTCSDAALRASRGPDAPASEMSDALRRLAHELRSELSETDQQLLTWVGDGSTRWQIAEWLGIGHEACAKRIWRLCHRLRSKAADRAKTFDTAERREIERFLRRAGSRDNERVREPGHGLADKRRA